MTCALCGERLIDMMAAPHVDVSIPATGGSVQLQTCSGGLEALWIRLRDDEGRRVIHEAGKGPPFAAPVRLTPSEARTLSDLLRRYADTHKETSE